MGSSPVSPTEKAHVRALTCSAQNPRSDENAAPAKAGPRSTAWRSSRTCGRAGNRCGLPLGAVPLSVVAFLRTEERRAVFAQVEGPLQLPRDQQPSKCHDPQCPRRLIEESHRPQPMVLVFIEFLARYAHGGDRPFALQRGDLTLTDAGYV